MKRTDGKGTTLRPSVAYNPGSLSESSLEDLKMGVTDELFDISNNFVQTNEILGDTFEKIDTLEIDRDNMNAKIEETYKLSVEDDKVLAQRIDEVSGWLEVGGDKLEGMITEESAVRLDGDKALAKKITEVEASFSSEDNKLDASIKEETTARVTADEALAKQVTELRAEVNEDVKASIKEEAEARATEDEAIAKRINTLSASMTTEDSKLSASIKTEEQARVNADGALSSQITSVKTEMDGKVSTINQTLSSTVNKLGEVEAKWGIEMDANGKVSGVSMNNNGKRSDFEVRADKFAFTDTSGGKSGGFSSSGGVTTFNGIINAQAGTFNGTVNAHSGVFNGTVNAHGGDFNNVTIRENCTVLGDLNANNIVGGLSNIVPLSTQPNQDYNFGVTKRNRSIVVSRFDVGITSPTSSNSSISAWCQITINGNVRTMSGKVTSTPQGGTKYYAISCGHVVDVPAGQPAVVSIRIWNDNVHGSMNIDSIGAFVMAV